MDEFKKILVDAGIPIAKFRGSDPPFQQQHTDLFCDLIEKHPLKILIAEPVLKEVSNKYSYLMSSVNSFFDKLKSVGKFELINKETFQNNLNKIHELRQNAKSEEFDLSFKDSLQAFHAQQTKYPLISWDTDLIDYCEVHSISAFRPNEFCDYYENKYC